MPEALYVPDGDTFVPTEWTRSPWGADSQHGGAPAALLVGLIEQSVTDVPMQVVRATFEFVRPVPLAPLSVSLEVIRGGGRVRLVDAVLSAGDDVVTRARVLLLRVKQVETWDVIEPHEVPPPPSTGSDINREWDWEAFHTHGVDVVYVRGAWLERGPATVWIKLQVPVVLGQPISPAQRVAAAADFGNGVSAVLPFGKWLFINPDLTIYMERPPSSEWVCLEARTYLTSNGIASAESMLYDAEGRIGRSVQSLLVDRL